MKGYVTPTQVSFIHATDDWVRPCGGIAYGDMLICGCCGAALPLSECTIIEEFDNWVDISAEIQGN